GVLHGFDQPCGAIVAYAQLALHRGDGRLAAFDDKGHGFVVEGVRLRVPLLATVTVAVAGHRDGAGGTLVGDVVQVPGHSPLFPVGNHLVHLVVVDKGPVNPDRDTGAGRQIEHVPVAEELVGTPLVENGPGVDLGGHLEGDAGGHIGLDQAGDH